MLSFGESDHFCVSRGQRHSFIKIEAKASICSWDVCFCCCTHKCECRNERLFFKTFFVKKMFFCSEYDLVLFGLILKSEVTFFIFECAPCHFCTFSWLLGDFFLEIDCINLKNLKAELATIIHSSISVLVSFCYLPTGPLGTVRWGS